MITIFRLSSLLQLSVDPGQHVRVSFDPGQHVRVSVDPANFAQVSIDIDTGNFQTAHFI